jgi:uncharacterized membrane protein
MFEFFFKYPRTVFQKGEFVFLSGWPGWLLIVLLVAAVAGLGWHLRRHLVGTGAAERVSPLRRGIALAIEAALLALLLFIAWHPAMRVATLRPQQNVIAVMVDTSKSMGLKESADTRLDKVQAALAGGMLDQIRGKFQVRLYGFSSQADRIEDPKQLTSTGAATRLGESLASVLQQTSTLPLGAVVVFTDGSDNLGSLDRGLMAELRQKKIPIHTVGVGRTEIPKDIEIVDVSVPTQALPGSRLNARVSLRQTGLTGQKAHLTIRDAGKILAARDIPLTASGQNVQTEEILFHSGEAGTRRLQVAIDPLPGEEVIGNNVLTRVVQVIPGRRRILYVEGEPRWEYKFIKRAADEDPTIRLVGLLRTTANKFYRQGIDNEQQLADGFPTKAVELFEYQALIIGTVEATFFTPAQQDLIKEFVNRRGGAALFLGGRHSFSEGGWGASAVAEILPVKLAAGTGTFHRSPVKVELTAQGRESLICRLDEEAAKNLERWGKMPDLADYQTTGEPKPGAVVLMNALLPGNRNTPMLVMQNYGRGRTLAMATGGSWRWRMRLDHKDVSHATFWQQLLRSMVSSTPDAITVTSDRPIYSDEQRVTLRAEVRTKTFEPANNATVAATITSDQGPTTVEMHPSPDQEGVYQVEWTAEKTGSYRVEVAAHRNEEDLGRGTLAFYREDGVAENFHPEQNRQLLERISEQTGGRYWPLEDSKKLPSELSFSEAGITTRESLDLWDMPILYFLALLLLSTGWLLRRTWGAI